MFVTALKTVSMAVLMTFGLNLWAFQASTVDVKPKMELQMDTCTVPGYGGKTLCGTLEVYENRTTRKGRKIGIKVVIIPAKNETPQPDPVFVLLGGPGLGAASLAGFLFNRYQSFHEDRDLVFVDMRGTGASNPLNCEFEGPEDSLQTYVQDMFDLEYVRRCRENLASKADLGMYTTEYAMADINDVRAALGYEKVNLQGGSYGTRAALEFMRQFPQHVRSAVLMGLAPMTIPIPQHFARDAETAFEAIFADCAADPNCSQTFPNLKEDSAKAFAAFEKEPVTQTVLNPNTKKQETVTMPKGAFITALRAMLYSSFQARQIPLFLHEAAQGDFESFIQYSANYNKGLMQALSDGLYLSMTCAEDLPFVDLENARKEAKDTFLGAYRIDQQWRACQQWVRGEVDTAVREQLKSDIPVLLISGEYDPVTPPYMAEKVAATLSHSLHVVVPNAGHDTSNGMACLIPMVRQFVEQGHVQGLDTACLKKVTRPDFRLSKK